MFFEIIGFVKKPMDLPRSNPKSFLGLEYKSYKIGSRYSISMIQSMFNFSMCICNWGLKHIQCYLYDNAGSGWLLNINQWDTIFKCF